MDAAAGLTWLADAGVANMPLLSDSCSAGSSVSNAAGSYEEDSLMEAAKVDRYLYPSKKAQKASQDDPDKRRGFGFRV